MKPPGSQREPGGSSFVTIKRKKHRNLSISMLFLVREAGLEFQFVGIYGIFETFIRVKRPFCIKYSNISN